MLGIIFQYGWEPFLIYWILNVFEAILENEFYNLYFYIDKYIYDMYIIYRFLFRPTPNNQPTQGNSLTFFVKIL